jgi:hypothetical protein
MSVSNTARYQSGIIPINVGIFHDVTSIAEDENFRLPCGEPVYSVEIIARLAAETWEN